jgi:hypothetical protein
MKKIIVGGCSHVFGHGLPDCIEGLTPSKLAWPALIEREFSCEIINFSEPGNSCIKNVRSIQNFKDLNSVSAILILLPYSKRRVLKNGNEEYNFTCTTPNNSNKLWNTTFERYQLYCHHDTTDDVNYLSYVGYLNYISLKHGIPLWVSGSVREDHELLQAHNFEVGMPDDWTHFCYTNKFSTTPDGHYGVDAHLGLYRNYIKPWLRNKVFK